MSLWRRTRDEMAGAWRSLRYDMGRRTDDDARDGGPVPDVTCTGMSTFGGTPAEPLRTAHDGPARPPRRLVAVTAFGVLTVVGAAGSYFAVVNGLGSLLHEPPSAPGPYPLAAAAPEHRGDTDIDSVAGMGRGTASVPGVTRTMPVPPTMPSAPAPVRIPVTIDGVPVRPAEPEKTGDVDCDCLTPPVPTPTAPPSPSPSPNPSPSASAGPTPPEDTPEPTDSGSPAPTGEPSTSALRRSDHAQNY